MLQSSLLVVGLSYPASPLAVRERFWLDAPRRMEAVKSLGTTKAIEESVLLVNAHRTEFIIWTSDLAAAAASVLAYLADHDGLSLKEWKGFYRLVDDAALAHLAAVSSGLQSRFASGAEVIGDLRSALRVARNAGVAGPRLEAAIDGVLQVATRLRNQTGVGFPANVPLRAALDLASQKSAPPKTRRVLVICAEPAAELRSVPDRDYWRVLSRAPATTPIFTDGHGNTIRADQCWQEMAQADFVVHLSSSVDFTLTKQQAQAIVIARNGAPLPIFDLAVPRAIDPAVAEIPGIVLYNVDDVRQLWEGSPPRVHPFDSSTQQVLAAQAKLLLNRLRSLKVVTPTIGYAHIKELCRDVAETYSAEVAASDEQAVAIEAVTARIATRIHSYLSKEHGTRRHFGFIRSFRRIFQERPSTRVPS